MKKRLRKKKRIYEFFEPFFEVSGEYAQDVSDEIIDRTLDELCDLVDSLNIDFYGNLSGCGFFSNDYLHPITKEQKQIIYDFFDKMFEEKVITIFNFHDTIDTYQKYLQWEKDFYK